MRRALLALTIPELFRLWSDTWRYRFENPFTLIVETLENAKVTSTSRYELRNGELGSPERGLS